MTGDVPLQQAMEEDGGQEAPVYDPFSGPDKRYEVKAADLVRQLVEPDSGGRWRRRSHATNSPTFNVTGCYITGILNLRGADLDFLLRFENCRFEHRPDVRESKLLGLAFLSCWLPGLKARNLRCVNDLRLNRSQVNLEPEQTGEPQTSMALSTQKEPGIPDAAIILTDAVVNGSVVLSRSEINYPERKAIQADRMSVSGALLAYRLSTRGEVSLPGLSTGGSVALSGARLVNPSGFALNGEGMRVGGSLLAEVDTHGSSRRYFTAKGVVYLPSARIDRDVVFRGARLNVDHSIEPAVDSWVSSDPYVDPKPALVADRIKVEGNLEFSDGLYANGTLRVLNAQVGGSLRLAGARIDVPRGEKEPFHDRALHLDGSEISSDVDATQLKVTGQCRLVDLHVGGNLLAPGAWLNHEGRDVVSARRTKVAGNLELDGCDVFGTLRLQGIEVGGNVDLQDTALTKPTQRTRTGFSLDLRTARLGRDLVLSQRMSGHERKSERTFSADGGVTLDGAKIARRLIIREANLAAADPGGESEYNVALDASDVVADEFVLTPGAPPRGRVNLRRAHCGTLDDSDELWGSTRGLELEDFRYDALRTPIALQDDGAVEKRIQRLHAAMRGYRPGPYDQLAAMLRASGNEEHASTVLLRKHKYRYDALRQGAGVLGPGVWLWSAMQRAVVGYGYRPIRAAAWLIVLLVLGSLWFWLRDDPCIQHPDRFTISGPRCLVNADDTGLEWNPVLHTADLLMPIVDLGNKGRWHMGGVDKWIATGFTAGGWILATTVAAGVARMVRRT